MAAYINRGSGTVSLYVNDVKIAKSKFSSIKERKGIMKHWLNTFSGFTYFGKVYIQVIHRNDFKALKNEPVIETPEPVCIEKKKPIKVKVPESKQTFIRHKGQYSNPQFNEYFEPVKNLD